MPPKSKSPIFVSQGDLAGSGWAALLRLLKDDLLDPELRARLVVVGDSCDRDAGLLKKIFRIIPAKHNEAITLSGRKPVFLALEHSVADWGKPGAAQALRSFVAFQKAMQLWQAQPSALVTLPVSKEWIIKAGVSFSGHTEQLGAAAGRTVFMCMFHPALSVVPLTNHIALRNVSSLLTETDFPALQDALVFYRDLFRPRKRLGWLGVNPHAGENGKIGYNEEAFLARQYERINSGSQLEIDGPISADSAFAPHLRKSYSLLIANYHDQGLIPFKALFGFSGVNVTLNLPKLRVSPDHGPGYSVAANPGAVDTSGVLASLKFAHRYADRWEAIWATMPFLQEA